MTQLTHSITRSTLRTQNLLFVVLFLFLVLIPTYCGLSHSQFRQGTANQSRLYWLQARTIHGEDISSYYGFQQLTLNETSSFILQGQINWNLTWDDGKTWFSNNATFAYGLDRTYEYAGLRCYTGWWIDPTVALGDQIRIDGDPPATNNFLHTAQFTVTDLVSWELHQQYYLCWQLTYLTSTGQHEIYHYEYHTGVLVMATSVLQVASHPVHEVHVELRSSNPSIPTIHPVLHFWVNYNSFIFAFLGATLVTLFMHYTLQRARSSSLKIGNTAFQQTHYTKIHSRSPHRVLQGGNQSCY